MKSFEMFFNMLPEGAATTMSVFFVTLIVALPLSIPVALLRLSPNKTISKITAFYIYLMRGTPLMLQLMFIFFALPLIPVVGIALERYTAIYAAFVLNYAAYYAEIIRGGVQAVPKGQWEAAKVLGLRKAYTFRKIIFPQVLKTVIPALSNEVITLVKDTSLVYVLGVTDVLKVAKSVSNTYSTFVPYILVGVIYLVIIALLTRLLSHIEKRVSYYK